MLPFYGKKMLLPFVVLITPKFKKLRKKIDFNIEAYGRVFENFDSKRFILSLLNSMVIEELYFNKSLIFNRFIVDGFYKSLDRIVGEMDLNIKLPENSIMVPTHSHGFVIMLLGIIKIATLNSKDLVVVLDENDRFGKNFEFLKLFAMRFSIKIEFIKPSQSGLKLIYARLNDNKFLIVGFADFIKKHGNGKDSCNFLGVKFMFEDFIINLAVKFRKNIVGIYLDSSKSDGVLYCWNVLYSNNLKLDYYFEFQKLLCIQPHSWKMVPVINEYLYPRNQHICGFKYLKK